MCDMAEHLLLVAHLCRRLEPKGAQGMLRKVLLLYGVASSVLYVAVDVLGSLRYQG